MATDREMIETLATKVMGWEQRIHTFDDGGRLLHYGPLTIMESRDEVAGWNPLESWADAGMVLEKLAELLKNGSVDTRRMSDGTACCMLEVNSGEVDESYIVTVEATTVPRAISLAAYQWAISQGELADA